MTFSRARLRGHRQGRRLSQTDLSLRSGLQAATLAEIEAGFLMPTMEQWLALAEALDLDVEELRSTGETWTREYIDTVIVYVTPMSDADIAAAARVLYAATRPQEAA